MADAAQVDISKSAKRRAAKKARDAEHEAQNPPAPVPEPPAPAAKSKAKAKATAKTAAKPKEAAKPATPEPKAKAKDKAKAEPKEEPKAQPKAQAEPKAKAKAKAKVKKEEPKEEPAPRKASADLTDNFIMDDGTGGDWEMTSGASKKNQRRKDRQAADAQVVQGYAGRTIPGAPQGRIPGMEAGVDSKAISQSVAASAAQIAKNAAGKAAAEAEVDRNATSVTIKIPENKIGILVGPKGATIKLLQEKSEARINIEGEVCVISGSADAVALGEQGVTELITKGYTSLTFENFQENSVQVHPSVFPDLIGKKGAIIIKLKEELGVEIGIPPTQPNAPANKKYKVTIAGKADRVEEAKNVINDIIMYGHHDITHPGMSHIEMEVPEWNYRFLIGKAGSELKHIQNNFKVKVSIPREHSANRQVVVVGDVLDCERAKTYMEKVLWNAENQTGGRGRTDGAVDGWGEEAEEEDWMGAYMYKRR